MNQDRAIFQVRVLPEGGRARALDLSDRVMSFEFLDHSAKADKLTLKVDNADLGNFDDPVWRKGAVLEVFWGYAGNVTDSRRCVIKKVKGGLELAIEAHALSMVMHQLKKCRVFKNVTLRQMADAIQAEYSSILQYEEKVRKDPNLGTLADNLQIVHAVQAAQTDAEFIAKQARKFGLSFFVDGKGKIRFEEANLKLPPVRTLTWRGGKGDWESFDIENDITAHLGAVTMKAVDTATKKAVEHRADNDSTKRDGLMKVVEVVDARTGATSYQQRAASESVEHTTAQEAGKTHVQAKAEGKFKGSQRSTIKLTGTVVGDPQLVAKRIIMVEGLGKRVSGRYRVVQARHTISESGQYKTDFVAKSDGHGGYGGTEGARNVPSKADANKSKALDAAGEDPIESVSVVDPRTGAQHIEFRTKRSQG